MPTILSLLDILVVLFVVISVARAIWNGPSEGSGMSLLGALLTLVLMIFGTVSMLAANGLTDNTAFNEGALLIFLVAIAGVAGMSWAKNPAQ
jgi:hypothetical protein